MDAAAARLAEDAELRDAEGRAARALAETQTFALVAEELESLYSSVGARRRPKRILEPLEMKDTGITLTADQKKRLTPGHDPGLSPSENWDFDALAGCGALRSTVA